MIASDFTDNSLTGITTVIGGFASITKTLTNDISLEGVESFQVNIRTGDPSGPIVGISSIISVVDSSVPTYEIAPSTLSINEEQSVTFTINTAGVPDNTTLYYSISGSSGLVAADFLDNALTGSFVINSNTGTITKTLSLDFTTEGNETFTLNVRRGSPTGTIVATSPIITIVDTSIAPYEFTSFTFTNAGVTGRTGPTLAQCLSSYNTTIYPWLTNTSFFNMVSQGKQLWTVKIGGVYEFDVRGARGGSYSNGGTTYTGAYGARIVSRVTLSIGQVIAIAVGQMGQDSALYPTAGGGSFVVLDSTSTPLIVAAGGAPAGSNGGGNLNTNAQGQITTFGGAPGSRGGGSGTNGGGGSAGRAGTGGNAADGNSTGSYSSASGGAGFYGSGGEAASSNSRGLKWSLGMLGGFSSAGDSTLVGGFGGGAGCASGLSAGGAGGYSGGGGSYNNNAAGQGGGSFTTSSFSGTNITATQGFNNGHGSVAVTLISITASYNTRPSTQNVNEGTTVTFRTDTVGVANTTLYYTISGSSGLVAADFTDNALTGSFNVVSGVGTTTKTLSNDLSIGEGTESFYMNVSTESTLGPVVTTSPTVYVYDTSNATFNITPSVGFLNEGSSVGFAVTTTNIPDNTTLYYSISGSAGISTSDFTDDALTGSFNIISNSATVTKTISNDLSSNEGIETFNMRILVGSTSGQITTTSSNVTIYDTSISPYVVTPSTLNVNEGSSVIFTTTTTAIPDTTLYYNIAGSAGISASDFTSNSLTGSFPLVSGVGSTTLTLSNDLTDDPNESFYMNVRTGSTSGPIVGVSSSVTINDTSINPALFPFTTFTFTNGTATGAGGPTSFAAVSSYTSQSWYASYFSLSSGIQSWTVPGNGTYRITTVGASGGENNGGTFYPGRPGQGAAIQGDFVLTQGTVLNLVVGQKGIYGSNGSGGGGGSFVYTGSVGGGGLLIAAGGGGGWGHGTPSYSTGALGGGGSATSTPVSGVANPSPPDAGSKGIGQGGFGGSTGSASGSGGGGAGWLSNGNNSDSGSGAGGTRFTGGTTNGVGGFGGGGSSGGSGQGGGGAGGYSGGGGATGWNSTSWGAGAGGGSYNSGTNRVNTAGTTGQSSGWTHGSITIENISTPSTTIITSGLILNLDAGNTSSYPGSGTTWTDLIGGNNGTLTNGPTYSGSNGGSIVFDGNNDYATTSSSVLPSPNSSPLTLEAFCMNTSGSGWQTVLGTHSSFTQIGFNGTTFYFGRNGGGGNLLVSSGASVPINTWCHIVMTYDGSLGYGYLNGSFITSGNIGSNGQTNGVSLLSTFTSASPSEVFAGRIAVARVYNRALSAAEVLQNFNALRGRYGI